MKDGWEYSTIGDLCDKMNGLWKGKIGPFINVGVIRNANFTKAFTLSFDNIEYLDVEAKQYKTRKLQKGDLIVEKSGGSEKQPVGRTVLFDKEEGEYSFSNFTSVLRIKDRTIISPEFLYKYILFVYLRGDTRKMQKATTGIHNIEFDKFLSILVPKISLSEQQSIVDYLDSAFAKIDAMKANAEKALNEAKALFQASLKEMLEPKEGWEEKMLKEVVASITDGDHQPPPKSDDGIPFITISNIDKNSNKIAFGETFYVPQSYYCALKKDRIPQQGDVLYTVTGSFGIPVLIDFQKDFCFQRHIALIRPKIGVLSPTYLFYWILSSYATSQAENTATGAAQRTVSLNSLRNFTIHIPTFSTQQSIVETLDSLKSKVDRLQANYDKISQECDALKQAILRQVFE